MKYKAHILFILTTIILSCGDKQSIPEIDCLPDNLSNGIVAFYPFENGSLADESGNANDLTNPNTATASFDRNGNASCAYMFRNNGNDEAFLTTANTNFLNGNSSFSVALWCQPMDDTRDGGKYEILLSRGEESRCPDRRGEWSVGLYDLRRAVFGHNNSVWSKDPLSAVPDSDISAEGNTNHWHHIVAVYDNNVYQIYLNGVLQETENGEATCSNLHLAEDSGDLFIGKFFTGKIDDVIIYDRVLTQQDVDGLFANVPCCN